MADTGAPWNLPFPLSTDLVRDGAQAIQDLAEATAAGLDLAGNPGIGSNVVSAAKLDVFTSSSTTNVTITGLEATITPSTDTAKVLIIAQITTNLAEYGIFSLGGGNAADYIGAAAGSRDRAVFAGGAAIAGEGSNQLVALTVVYLDSPATTSPVTYSVQGRARSGAPPFSVNARPSGSDTDASSSVRGASSITVIEVAP